MMTVRHSLLGDVEKIEAAEHFERVEDWRRILGQPDAEHFLYENCRTFETPEDGICGMGGVTPTGPSSGEIWFLLSPAAYRHRVGLARHAVALIGVARSVAAADRLTCTIRAASPVAATQQRFMERLGFENETPGGMRNFLDGETYYLYARTWDDVYSGDRLE